MLVQCQYCVILNPLVYWPLKNCHVYFLCVLYLTVILYFRMTIATRGQTVGLDSTDNQTNVQVSTYFYYDSVNIDAIDTMHLFSSSIEQ